MQVNKIQPTTDGSDTVFSEKFNALYHSKHGAIQESQHVFINSGLRYLDSEIISILEMGFGTGLNALLTYDYAVRNSLIINYHTVEAYPLDPAITSQLNYGQQLKSEELSSVLQQLHSTDWNTPAQLGPMLFHKYESKLQDQTFHTKFDLVYYDAFAPLTQEELWTPEVFQHIGQFLKPNAVLVSYCCKGIFKRSLRAAGIEFEKIPGPPGKREMIRAFFKGLS